MDGDGYGAGGAIYIYPWSIRNSLMKSKGGDCDDSNYLIYPGHGCPLGDRTLGNRSAVFRD